MKNVIKISSTEKVLTKQELLVLALSLGARVILVLFLIFNFSQFHGFSKFFTLRR